MSTALSPGSKIKSSWPHYTIGTDFRRRLPDIFIFEQKDGPPPFLTLYRSPTTSRQLNKLTT